MKPLSIYLATLLATDRASASVHETNNGIGLGQRSTMMTDPMASERRQHHINEVNCEDDGSYINKKLGISCDDIERLELICDGFDQVGLSVDDKEEILKSCPQSCGVPACGSGERALKNAGKFFLEETANIEIHRETEEECVDDPTYTSKIGLPCEEFATLELVCTRFGLVGYSEVDVYELVNSCPESCSVPCGTWTVTPSAAPSEQPTISQQPSSLPSSSPTSSPSEVPTEQPSSSPTSSPSASPSASPSSSPSALPTFMPSSTPTALPSSSPTSEPTVLPSVSPTSSPSSSPSSSPTSSPSSLPTTSQSPSAEPSSSPSESPTSAPSASPSVSPTSTPSASPSESPTSSPSDAPSKSPSASPSESPTSTPSASPSESPTSSPSDAPSASPTTSPSDAPSAEPTVMPTDVPSSSPSHQPSALPTSSPSTSPSDSPSATPTLSFMPTTTPSAQPSASPSSSPTGIPSSSPTSAPSSTPSESPTDAPSSMPSSQPTPEFSLMTTQLSFPLELTTQTPELGEQDKTVLEDTALSFVARTIASSNGTDVQIDSIDVVSQEPKASNQDGTRSLQNKSTTEIVVSFTITSEIRPWKPGKSFGYTPTVLNGFANNFTGYLEELHIASKTFKKPEVHTAAPASLETNELTTNNDDSGLPVKGEVNLILIAAVTGGGLIVVIFVTSLLIYMRRKSAQEVETVTEVSNFGSRAIVLSSAPQKLEGTSNEERIVQAQPGRSQNAPGGIISQAAIGENRPQVGSRRVQKGVQRMPENISSQRRGVKKVEKYAVLKTPRSQR